MDFSSDLITFGSYKYKHNTSEKSDLKHIWLKITIFWPNDPNQTHGCHTPPPKVWGVICNLILGIFMFPGRLIFYAGLCYGW